MASRSIWDTILKTEESEDNIGLHDQEHETIVNDDPRCEPPQATPPSPVISQNKNEIGSESEEGCAVLAKTSPLNINKRKHGQDGNPGKNFLLGLQKKLKLDTLVVPQSLKSKCGSTSSLSIVKSSASANNSVENSYIQQSRTVVLASPTILLSEGSNDALKPSEVTVAKVGLCVENTGSTGSGVDVIDSVNLNLPEADLKCSAVSTACSASLPVNTSMKIIDSSYNILDGYSNTQTVSISSSVCSAASKKPSQNAGIQLSKVLARALLQQLSNSVVSTSTVSSNVSPSISLSRSTIQSQCNNSTLQPLVSNKTSAVWPTEINPVPCIPSVSVCCNISSSTLSQSEGYEILSNHLTSYPDAVPGVRNSYPVPAGAHSTEVTMGFLPHISFAVATASQLPPPLLKNTNVSVSHSHVGQVPCHGINPINTVSLNSSSHIPHSYTVSSTISIQDSVKPSALTDIPLLSCSRSSASQSAKNNYTSCNIVDSHSLICAVNNKSSSTFKNSKKIYSKPSSLSQVSSPAIIPNQSSGDLIASTSSTLPCDGTTMSQSCDRINIVKKSCTNNGAKLTALLSKALSQKIRASGTSNEKKVSVLPVVQSTYNTTSTCIASVTTTLNNADLMASTHRIERSRELETQIENKTLTLPATGSAVNSIYTTTSTNTASVTASVSTVQTSVLAPSSYLPSMCNYSRENTSLRNSVESLQSSSSYSTVKSCVNSSPLLEIDSKLTQNLYSSSAAQKQPPAHSKVRNSILPGDLAKLSSITKMTSRIVASRKRDSRSSSLEENSMQSLNDTVPCTSTTTCPTISTVTTTDNTPFNFSTCPITSEVTSTTGYVPSTTFCVTTSTVEAKDYISSTASYPVSSSLSIKAPSSGEVNTLDSSLFLPFSTLSSTGPAENSIISSSLPNFFSSNKSDFCLPISDVPQIPDLPTVPLLSFGENSSFNFLNKTCSDNSAVTCDVSPNLMSNFGAILPEFEKPVRNEICELSLGSGISTCSSLDAFDALDVEIDDLALLEPTVDMTNAMEMALSLLDSELFPSPPLRPDKTGLDDMFQLSSPDIVREGISQVAVSPLFSINTESDIPSTVVESLPNTNSVITDDISNEIIGFDDLVPDDYDSLPSNNFQKDSNKMETLNTIENLTGNDDTALITSSDIDKHQPSSATQTTSLAESAWAYTFAPISAESNSNIDLMPKVKEFLDNFTSTSINESLTVSPHTTVMPELSYPSSLSSIENKSACSTPSLTEGNQDEPKTASFPITDLGCSNRIIVNTDEVAKELSNSNSIVNESKVTECSNRISSNIDEIDKELSDNRLGVEFPILNFSFPSTSQSVSVAENYSSSSSSASSLTLVIDESPSVQSIDTVVTPIVSTLGSTINEKDLSSVLTWCLKPATVQLGMKVPSVGPYTKPSLRNYSVPVRKSASFTGRKFVRSKAIKKVRISKSVTNLDCSVVLSDNLNIDQANLNALQVSTSNASVISDQANSNCSQEKCGVLENSELQKDSLVKTNLDGIIITGQAASEPTKSQITAEESLVISCSVTTPSTLTCSVATSSTLTNSTVKLETQVSSEPVKKMFNLALMQQRLAGPLKRVCSSLAEAKANQPQQLTSVDFSKGDQAIRLTDTSSIPHLAKSKEIVIQSDANDIKTERSAFNCLLFSANNGQCASEKESFRFIEATDINKPSVIKTECVNIKPEIIDLCLEESQSSLANRTVSASDNTANRTMVPRNSEPTVISSGSNESINSSGIVVIRGLSQKRRRKLVEGAGTRVTRRSAGVMDRNKSMDDSCIIVDDQIDIKPSFVKIHRSISADESQNQSVNNIQKSSTIKVENNSSENIEIEGRLQDTSLVGVENRQQMLLGIPKKTVLKRKGKRSRKRKAGIVRPLKLNNSTHTAVSKIDTKPENGIFLSKSEPVAEEPNANPRPRFLTSRFRPVYGLSDSSVNRAPEPSVFHIDADFAHKIYDKEIVKRNEYHSSVAFDHDRWSILNSGHDYISNTAFYDSLAARLNLPPPYRLIDPNEGTPKTISAKLLRKVSSTCKKNQQSKIKKLPSTEHMYWKSSDVSEMEGFSGSRLVESSSVNLPTKISKSKKKVLKNKNLLKHEDFVKTECKAPKLSFTERMKMRAAKRLKSADDAESSSNADRASLRTVISISNGNAKVLSRAGEGDEGDTEHTLEETSESCLISRRGVLKMTKPGFQNSPPITVQKFTSPADRATRFCDGMSSFSATSVTGQGVSPGASGKCGRMLKELEYSKGYIVDEHHSVKKGDGDLLKDSTSLSREERALQMALMRIAEMENKEAEKLSPRSTSSKLSIASASNTSIKASALMKKAMSHHSYNNVSKFGKSSSSTFLASAAECRVVLDKTSPDSINSYNVHKVHGKDHHYSSASGRSRGRGVRLTIKRSRERFDDGEGGGVKRASRGRGGRVRGMGGLLTSGGVRKSRGGRASESLSTLSYERFGVMKPLTVDVKQMSEYDVIRNKREGWSSPSNDFRSMGSTASTLSAMDCDPLSSPSDSHSLSILPRILVPSELRKIAVCHSTGETLLHKASRLGYEDAVLWCCQSGYIDVNTRDHAGYSALHEACLGSQLRVASYLIHYGADVNAASRADGTRPIHEAVRANDLRMIRLLVSHGAYIEPVTSSGRTVHNMTTSNFVKSFLRAHLVDIFGESYRDCETGWDVSPQWNEYSTGCENVLSGAPDDDDSDDDDDDDVIFDMNSEKLLQPVKLLDTACLGVRNHLLLSDLLSWLRIGKVELLFKYPHISIQTARTDQLIVCCRHRKIASSSSFSNVGTSTSCETVPAALPLRLVGVNPANSNHLLGSSGQASANSTNLNHLSASGLDSRININPQARAGVSCNVLNDSCIRSGLSCQTVVNDHTGRSVVITDYGSKPFCDLSIGSKSVCKTNSDWSRENLSKNVPDMSLGSQCNSNNASNWSRVGTVSSNPLCDGCRDEIRDTFGECSALLASLIGSDPAHSSVTRGTTCSRTGCRGTACQSTTCRSTACRSTACSGTACQSSDLVSIPTSSSSNTLPSRHSMPSLLAQSTSHFSSMGSFTHSSLLPTNTDSTNSLSTTTYQLNSAIRTAPSIRNYNPLPVLDLSSSRLVSAANRDLPFGNSSINCLVNLSLVKQEPDAEPVNTTEQDSVIPELIDSEGIVELVELTDAVCAIIEKDCSRVIV